MYVDYMFFAVIALVTGVVILLRILSSNMRYQEKGFLQLIIFSICHNIIDIFWGLTYFDKIGMGPLGLQISTSLYFCSNTILAFVWFNYLYRLLHEDKTQKWVIVPAGIPLILVILMVFANISTGALFTIGDTVDSYARGRWYIIERIGTTGYLVVIFIWSAIKLFQAKEKSERKKYSIITAFAVVPLVFDMLQVLFLAVPCTSIAFQIAIIIVYAFISVERSENVLLSASDRQKNNMKSALAQTAMSWYEFNVERDCIYDSKIYIEEERYVKRPDEVAERYSSYYDFLAGRVFPAYKSAYKDTFSLENLKHSFEKGESDLSLRYWMTDSAGEEKFILQNMILTQDHVTKEIIGFAYTRDVTSEERQKREIEEQLEEIKALNAQLEEKQQKLEEMGAEQEAQIEEIKEINVELSNRIALIQSMSKVYFASFFIDFKNGTFEEINNIQSVRETIGSGGDAQEALYKICDNMVSPKTADDFRRFVTLETLDERMRDTDVITCEYIGFVAGWCRLYMIAGDRDVDGSIQTLFIAARTIHEEKAREEKQNQIIEEARIAAERANSAKTDFLFTMSHDIRTPMNAIIGFTDLLEKYQEDPEKRADYLRKIQDSNKVLLSIINNVLEMARIEKGKLELEEAAWSAEQFNDTLYSVFQEMMRQKDIEFTRQIVVQHHYVFCDTIKLREIFINILSNAYKYTDPGGKVTMLLEEIPSDREGYLIYRTTISDTGIGMSEEYIPHIFEEFSRENSMTDNKVEGTGLGMPIVKRLVEFMDGTIEVQSTRGVGTTFIVTLPHRIADRENLVEHAGGAPDQQLFRKKRILLAEDNELNAEIAIEILQEVGFEIEWAEDGHVAVNMVKEADAGYYDLILMDIQMPNMNGYVAARTIRTLSNPDKANIPILALTANAFEEDKKDAMRAGMNGHLGKPINVNELMKALAGILSQSSKERK